MGRFFTSSIKFKTFRKSSMASRASPDDDVPRPIVSIATPPSPDGFLQMGRSKSSSPTLEIVGTEILKTNDQGKPTSAYCKIIAYAIATSEDRMMSLNDIYAFFSAHFPYFKPTEAKHGWKNTIRHNLSHLPYFLKSRVSSPEPGKGNMWLFDPRAALEEGFVIDLTPDDLRDLEDKNQIHLSEQPTVTRSKMREADSEEDELNVETKVKQEVVELVEGEKESSPLDELVVTTQAPPTTCPDEYFTQLMANLDDLSPMTAPAEPLKPTSIPLAYPIHSTDQTVVSSPVQYPPSMTKVYSTELSMAPSTPGTYYLPSKLVTKPTPVTVANVAPMPPALTNATLELLQNLLENATSPTSPISPTLQQQLELLNLRQQYQLNEIKMLEQLLSPVDQMPSLPLIGSPKNSPEMPTTIAPFQLHVSATITGSPILMSSLPRSNSGGSEGSLKRKRT